MQKHLRRTWGRGLGLQWHSRLTWGRRRELEADVARLSGGHGQGGLLEGEEVRPVRAQRKVLCRDT